MKRIATLTCHDASGTVCTGAGCLSAFNARTGTFAAYAGEAVELVAFLQCNGCQTPITDAGLTEKLERIFSLHPDAVHVGVCTKKPDGSRCSTIKTIMNQLSGWGIPCIDGTHR